MKTAVTVLNEMMIKSGKLPEYECMSQSGPQHQAVFEYRCKCAGVTVSGQARSKKEAKQEAARKMLAQLNARGHPVPAPYDTPLEEPPSPPSPTNKPALEAGPSGGGGGGGGGGVDARSYVALLRELCGEYRLQEPEYELVGDTGPPHQRHFTVRAALGLHERQATSTTKKAARQLAAEQLYKYLREHLARVTHDFVEEEALKRATERRAQEKRAASAAERYAQLGGEAPAWRPHLGQRLADYHLEAEAAEAGARVVREAEAQAEAEAGEAQAERALAEACAALGLRAQADALAPRVAVVRLVPSAPPLAFAADSPGAAAAAALSYLRRALPAARVPLI